MARKTALLRGRFAGGSEKRTVDFTESVSFDKRLYKYDIMGSRAHVGMLADCKIIPQKTASDIKAGLDKIEADISKGKFKFLKSLEDIHMNIEQSLIDILGEDGARLHAARSRNDQISLDIRLYLRDETDLIVGEIRKLQSAFVTFAADNSAVIMPGYTHLQRAQPVLFAHHLLAYVEMLERDAGRLLDCRKRINVMPLGSGAIGGTGLPVDRNKTASVLKFPEISQNSMDAVADRDFVCEFISCLAIFAMHISRFSEDLILWCSGEFDFIRLDDSFCTGSSLMPQKKNPDIAELSRGKTGRIYGALVSILTVCKGLPLSYNRDLQEDKEPLFDAIDTAKKILSVYPHMILTMKVNRKKMLEAASDPALMAADLAEELVRTGMPFRMAHKKVGQLVRWCEKKGRALNQLTYGEISEIIPEAADEFHAVFKPERSIALREIPGGTGFLQVAAQIDRWKKKLKSRK